MNTLTVSREPRGVARITTARPEVLNAFDEEMVSELDMAHRVVAAAELDAAVDEQIGSLLANGPRAQQEIKSLIARIAVGPITGEVRELTVRTIGRVRGSDEAREGLEAFFEKRPANWTRTDES